MQMCRYLLLSIPPVVPHQQFKAAPLKLEALPTFEAELMPDKGILSWTWQYLIVMAGMMMRT
jgi:hypothetical protein